MKLFKIQSIVLLLVFYINGQAQKTILCPKYNISINSNYDSITLAKIYDFLNNKLEKIKLVRIKPHIKTETYIGAFNSNPLLKERKREIYQTIISEDTIENDMIEDSKNLNDSNFLQIIQFMFSQDNLNLRGRCGYEPRNGILFYGAGNEFLGFIEICFKCTEFRHTGNLLPPIDISGKDIDELKSLFESYNISVY